MKCDYCLDKIHRIKVDPLLLSLSIREMSDFSWIVLITEWPAYV